MPGDCGREKRDARTNILANRVSATKTKANVVCRSRMAFGKNYLLRKMRVDAKLHILPALRININCGKISRIGDPFYDNVLLGDVIR